MITMIKMMIIIRACFFKRTRKKIDEEYIKTSGKRGEASVERYRSCAYTHRHWRSRNS